MSKENNDTKNMASIAITEQNKVTAQTILQQLGGNKFKAMTGAHNMRIDACDKGTTTIILNYKGSPKANTLSVMYNPGKDLYTMRFLKITPKAGVKETAKFEDVYCDMLQELFTANTGLYTSL